MFNIRKRIGFLLPAKTMMNQNKSTRREWSNFMGRIGLSDVHLPMSEDLNAVHVGYTISAGIWESNSFRLPGIGERSEYTKG